MRETVAARVARGAALLDRQIPGWERRIDLETLHLQSPCLCVLGQLHPGQEFANTAYSCGLDRLALTTTQGYYHGFDAGCPSVDAEDGDYDALTAEWHQVITERRGGTGA
jgi:hypothetical protein